MINSLSVKFKAYMALLTICFVWGGTFLAVSISVSSLPPLFLSGFRQLISGGLLTLLLMRIHKTKIPAGDWKSLLISGACIVFLSNTLVIWSLNTLPGGLVAIFMTSIPVWITLLHLIIKFKLPHYMTLLGLVAGLAGMVLIFNESMFAISDPHYWISMTVLLTGTFFWALGSILVSNYQFSISPFLVAGIQLLVYGILLLVISFFLEDWNTIRFPASAWASLFYLIVFDQMIAYAAYIYALRHLPVSVVSIFVYINPVVAVFLGWLVRNEIITVQLIAAAVIIFLGVYLLNKRPA